MISIDKVISYTLIISALIVGIGVVAWFYVSGEKGSTIKELYGGNLQVINFQMLEPDKNGYLLCAPNSCAEGRANAQSKTYPVSRAKLSLALFSYTDNNVAIKIFRRDLGAWQFDFTERLQGEKFPHVITVQFIDLSPSESSLNIYSRSELGSSKAGIHKERIERWLQFMESALSG